MELLIFWLAVAVVTSIAANSRGRSGFGWFLLGCAFSLLALLLVVILPARKDTQRDPNAPSPDTHVRCPDCRELVYKDARKCKHCGTGLIPSAD